MSAYAAATGAEPAFTSAHTRFLGTVDYIWFTDQPLTGSGARLAPARVLAPPPLAALPAGLPTRQYGSDHLAVAADFVWVDGDQAGGCGEP